MPFLVFLKSFEVFLYEIMSWIVFYPRTLWRATLHPLRMMDRTEGDLKLEPGEQFKDILSPPIFLLITVVAANGIEVAVVGNSKLIDDGIGLAAMITDNTSLIFFRLVAFATVPVIAGAFALAVLGRPLDRVTLQPVFYAQCFATTPIILLCSIAETVSRLTQRTADVAAVALLIAAAGLYLGVETAWFARETKSGRARGALYAVILFAMSAVVLGGTILLFAGI